MTAERVQARVFGEVADEYDRIRPAYPDALVDDVLAYARLDGAPAVEPGAGTGKATAMFAARGIDLTAVEPDAAMAGVLDRRLGERSGVSVVISSFEDFRPERAFGLLYSAQAWHWVDPDVRWRKAAEVLAPGGAVALFWHVDMIKDAAVLDAALAVYRAHTPHIVPDTGLPTEASIETSGWWRELERQTAFQDLSARLYPSERTLSTTDYLALLTTRSAIRMLGDDVRAGFLGALRDVLGDQVTLSVTTALYLARRTP
ncbi:class I SAM-dependent methyltransferase [Nonomuraea diastatica]|uniref:Class I SAM-dependent methyltransferase n=1 Tax=Nonomuraea diastatica TaxID=1848329 RepID=A0A4R4WW87_9ACTN|nr:methyltransferase domain-containing protein [Nonomuraea diastatica]TDD22004.1 class I SAM-dependent methyltransferase [Nonomuraea diastatica]